MVSIHVYRRKRKRQDGTVYHEPVYSAQIVFGRKDRFYRSTGSRSEREAKRVAKQIADQIERDVLPKRGKEIITLDHLFGRWWQEYGQKLKDPVTIKGRVKRIVMTVGPDMPVRQVSDVTVNDFVQTLYAEGASGATINRHTAHWRQAWNMAAKKWGYEVGEVDWPEHRQKEGKEKLVFLTPDEARALMNASPEHIALAIAWSIYTGCRLDETETLEWSKVDPAHRVAIVWAKGGRERPVLLSQVAMRILDFCARQTGRNRVFDLTNRRKHWEAAREAIGRPDLRWHDLRHVNGTWLNQYSRADIRKIQHGLGHADVGTTTRYVHVHDDSLYEALDELPDVTQALLANVAAHDETGNIGKSYVKPFSKGE